MERRGYAVGAVSRVVLGLCGVLLVSRSGWSASAGDQAVTLTLSAPQPYQVIQRDEHGQGQIPVKGICTGHVTRVEARYEILANTAAQSGLWRRWFGRGRSVRSAWSCVCTNPINGVVAGTLSVPAGGWYRVTVRALDGKKEVARRVVEKVGAGEVFITAGQSNAGNYGWPRQTPVEDRVATHCAWCEAWRHGYDPQPWGGGTGGSPWPAMEDALVRALDVPVAVISLSAGGTSVSNWLPSSKQCYGSLPRALNFVGPHGARAILWHQGESDAYLGTSADEYAQGMGEIIAQSRKDAGWDIPWGIALASFLPENPNNPPPERPGPPREWSHRSRRSEEVLPYSVSVPRTVDGRSDRSGVAERHDSFQCQRVP
ncbi:MAG: sialate O-acetylesterase [Kiritimatiellae bacterium]|nr:sialate O-acetylesterase [Kiritimatiellia bacterium]